ncbi:hypothetical protein [Oceanobacillus sp. CAU 1775]
MTKREHEKDILSEVLDKKQQTQASQEAKEKSLRAFQDGLKDSARTPIKRKKFGLRKHVVGVFSSVAAVGIITVLAFGVFDVPSPEDTGGQGNEDIQEEVAPKVMDQQEISNILNEILKRQPLDLGESADFQRVGFSNLDLMTYVPADWIVEEMEDGDKLTMQLSGPTGEEMTLQLFKQDAPDVFSEHLEEVEASYAHAEEIPIELGTFIETLKSNPMVSSNYDDIFPFELTNADMVAFIDKENGTFHDFITSELFGYQMIFTSKLSLEDTESWDLPIHLFTELHAVGALDIHDSIGRDHLEYNRPIEKTVLLPIGASFTPDVVQMELYENEELQLTSYLPIDTEVGRIEHDQFTEWRFTNSSISDDSFYSIGKLKEEFPLKDGEEIMFDAFDIDLAFAPPEIAGAAIPNHYSYASANSGEDGEINISGFFEFFESNNEWYYMHKHANYDDYNGGYLITRLDYFIKSIEWH